MSLIAYLIILAASGLLIGALARLALPGADPMTLPKTMLVGVAGSLVAGVIAPVVFGSAPGIILSVLAATGIVYIIRRRRGGEPLRPFGSQT
jgi:uncharacterized membrane protein YeaQ/YmgE (transglycosylase-associated protein family)